MQPTSKRWANLVTKIQELDMDEVRAKIEVKMASGEESE